MEASLSGELHLLLNVPPRKPQEEKTTQTVSKLNSADPIGQELNKYPIPGNHPISAGALTHQLCLLRWNL